MSFWTIYTYSLSGPIQFHDQIEASSETNKLLTPGQTAPPPQCTPDSSIHLCPSTLPLRCLMDLYHLNELAPLPMTCLVHSIPYLSKQQFTFFSSFSDKRKLDVVAFWGVAFCGLPVAHLAFL